jgi:hypothetical protein
LTLLVVHVGVVGEHGCLQLVLVSEAFEEEPLEFRPLIFVAWCYGKHQFNDQKERDSLQKILNAKRDVVNCEKD